MTETQIKYFLTLSETLNFSRTAVKLYVSQSAVSKIIATLEAELNTVLFHRDSKNITLTHTGEVLLHFLKAYSKELDATLNHIKTLESHTLSGTICLGCRPTWNALHFYGRISDYLAAHHPDVKLEIKVFDACGPLPMLNDGKIDVAIVYDVEPVYYNDVAFKPLTTLGIGLAYSAADPRFQGAVSITDFSDVDILTVSTPAGKILSKFYEKEFAALDFTPHFRQTPSMSHAMMEALVGSGAVILDEWELSLTNAAFRYLPLGCRLPVRLVYLTKNMTAIKSIFLKESMHFFPENEPRDPED